MAEAALHCARIDDVKIGWTTNGSQSGYDAFYDIVDAGRFVHMSSCADSHHAMPYIRWQPSWRFHWLQRWRPS